jgi:hypothetical protein
MAVTAKRRVLRLEHADVPTERAEPVPVSARCQVGRVAGPVIDQERESRTTPRASL